VVECAVPVLDAVLCEELIGSSDAALVAAVLERMRLHATLVPSSSAAEPIMPVAASSASESRRVGTSLLPAGALLSRIRVAESASVSDADAAYAVAHCDKANRAAYDVSAVCYLATAGVLFGGGAFAFLDADADRIVEPRAGRLVMFDAGLRNVHRVERVAAGERVALAAWFSRVDDARDGDGSAPAPPKRSLLGPHHFPPRRRRSWLSEGVPWAPRRSPPCTTRLPPLGGFASSMLLAPTTGVVATVIAVAGLGPAQTPWSYCPASSADAIRQHCRR